MRPRRSAASATSAARSMSNRTRASSAASPISGSGASTTATSARRAGGATRSLQNPDRIFYPRVRDEDGVVYEVTWDDAIDTIAETLAHYQGDQFAALASPDSTNEEVYALQQFTRAVMGTNNIDRHADASPARGRSGRSRRAR